MKNLALAVALARWEMGDDDEPWNLTAEEFQNWLAESHAGDCTNACGSCVTCFAEDMVRKADWVSNELKKESNI